MSSCEWQNIFFLDLILRLALDDAKALSHSATVRSESKNVTSFVCPKKYKIKKIDVIRFGI